MNSTSLSSGPGIDGPQTGNLALSESAARPVDTRLRLLDNIWLLTLLSLLFVTTLTWFAGGLDINFATVAGGLLGLGAIYLVFAAAADLGLSTCWLRRSLVAAHLLGVLIVGFVWQQAGGLQNPLFLLAFVLPVIGSSFLSRWQPYLTALLGIGVVAVVALTELPELRWYVAGLDVPGAGLAALFGNAGRATSQPFPGFHAPVGYFILLFAMFSLLLLACALAAEGVATLCGRLEVAASAAQGVAARAEARWTELIRGLPAAAALIEVDTLRIVVDNERFVALLETATAGVGALVGKPLLERLCLSYPEVVEALIAGEGTVASPCPYRVADQQRIAEIRVQRLMLEGRRHAIVVVEDITQSFCLSAALDSADYAALVIDSQGRVLSANKPALGLFVGVALGAPILNELNDLGPRPRWWEPGLSDRRKALVEISRRTYQVTSSTVEVPGEQEGLCVLAFRPVATAPAPDRADTRQGQGSASLTASTTAGS